MLACTHARTHTHTYARTPYSNPLPGPLYNPAKRKEMHVTLNASNKLVNSLTHDHSRLVHELSAARDEVSDVWVCK